MYALVIRRLLMVIPTLFFVSLLSFAIIRAAPGDLVRMYTSSGMSKADSADVERIREKLGLNDPLPVQYLRWLEQAVLGYSITHQPVSELIMEKLPAPLSLMGISLVLSMSVGLVAGSIAAVKRSSLFDCSTTIFASLGSMLQKGLTRLQDAPWLVWFPGFLIAATVLAFNFAGDGVRDALDPKTIK